MIEIRCVLLAIMIAVIVGCSEQEPASSTPSPSRVAPVGNPSAWHNTESSAVVAVHDDAAQRDLDAAMAQARATAEQARLRWLSSPANDRAHWAVKWAAPLAPSATTTSDNPGPANPSQTVEHVWIQPIANWSAFRIEGVLASEPVHDLECGKTRGEFVSFPIEELSDWIHFLGDDLRNGAHDVSAPYEGGLTVKALAQRYGRPGANSSRP